MNKIKKKAFLYALLLSLTSLKLTGCSKGENVDTKFKIEDYNFIKTDLENAENQKRAIPLSQMQEIPEEIEAQENLFLSIPVVIANTNVNIRNHKDGDVIGVLPENASLNLLDYLDGWYQVDYYGKVGYIREEYVTCSTEYMINRKPLKVCYSLNELTLTIPKEVNNQKIEETKTIPALECFEVYFENQDRYLVQTEDFIGYVAKNALHEFVGTFIVVDISNQELKLYKDNQVILTTPVVTGGPNSPTTEGLFEIYDISYNRYLVGPNYKSYVDIMMKFNNNEGLHDAEYHTNLDGFSHGWREKNEFGGNTYLTHGSHGCVNMKHDDVFEVSKYATYGTPVLVKK